MLRPLSRPGFIYVCQQKSNPSRGIFPLTVYQLSLTPPGQTTQSIGRKGGLSLPRPSSMAPSLFVLQHPVGRAITPANSRRNSNHRYTWLSCRPSLCHLLGFSSPRYLICIGKDGDGNNAYAISFRERVNLFFFYSRCDKIHEIMGFHGRPTTQIHLRMAAKTNRN